MSTTREPCPICGVADCGGVVYPHLVKEFLAGRNKEHWRGIHDRTPMPKSNHEYPSIMAQAANAAGAAVGFAKSGFKVVDEREQGRRLAICRECPYYDAARGRCRLCGCLTKLKAKIQSGDCPDKPPRW